MNRFKEEIVKLLNQEVKGIDAESLLEIPPDPKMGDYAFPCFALAKKLKKTPVEIAAALEKSIGNNSFLEKVRAEGPYLNFYLNKAKQAEIVLTTIYKEKSKYGASSFGKGKTVVIDYSSPNIAKPFGIAHLRSTMIGNSLYKIYSFLGYKCISINHLGDWGTQFGKLIVAYKRWGIPTELRASPIKHLLNIYVKFHEEAEKNPLLENEARDWFKKLELGDKEAEKLWKIFSNHSLREFKKTYQRIGVKFDVYAGESTYNKLINPFVEDLEKKGITEASEGALVVNLDKFGMPPCILRKSDGATTYETRDLVAASYRYDKYKFNKLLYVIDSRQSLHMQQVFKVFEMAGKSWVGNCLHIGFGVMKFPEGVMSTRKGKVIFLEDVLDKTKERVLKIIEEKNPNLQSKEEIAEKVATGAIVFWDLSHDRIRDIVFEWDKVLDFEGETGPYVQYSYTRAISIIRKAKEEGLEVTSKVDFGSFKKPEELKVIILLGSLNSVLASSAEHYKPSIVARYVLDLAQAFNTFYHNCSCLAESDKELSMARLLLVSCVENVLREGLTLLGMEAPQSM